MPDAADPVVSIAVPNYNNGLYIVSCLRSIVGSGYDAIEIIVVDDGSTDDSASQIEKFFVENSRIRIVVLRHESNRGIACSLNAAIRAASGVYFAILAADDLLLPGGIRSRVEYLETHPDKLAVFADCRVVNGEGALLHESGLEGFYAHSGMRKSMLERDIGYALLFHWNVPGPGFMCRKSAFDEIGSYDETYVVEDWDIYVRLAARNALGFLNQTVADYRFHGGNAIERRQEEMARDFAKSALKNSVLFHGAFRWRLQGFYYLWKYNTASSPGTKAVYFLRSRLFLALARIGVGGYRYRGEG